MWSHAVAGGIAKSFYTRVLSTDQVLSCMYCMQMKFAARRSRVSQTVNWALLASTFGVRERKVGFVGGRRQKNLCLWPRTRSGSTRRSFIDSSGTFTLRLWRGGSKISASSTARTHCQRANCTLQDKKKYAPCRNSRASKRKNSHNVCGQETNLFVCCK